MGVAVDGQLALNFFSPLGCASCIETTVTGSQKLSDKDSGGEKCWDYLVTIQHNFMSYCRSLSPGSSVINPGLKVFRHGHLHSAYLLSFLSPEETVAACVYMLTNVLLQSSAFGDVAGVTAWLEDCYLFFGYEMRYSIRLQWRLRALCSTLWHLRSA